MLIFFFDGEISLIELFPEFEEFVEVFLSFGGECPDSFFHIMKLFHGFVGLYDSRIDEMLLFKPFCYNFLICKLFFDFILFE